MLENFPAMQYLLSLPENLSSQFQQIENRPSQTWFASSDPKGVAVGSGGGSCWLLYSQWKASGSTLSFEEWLVTESRVLIHAGGESRRLPAYAPSGKILTPIPVFRWAKGQSLRQNLLDLQLPLFSALLESAKGDGKILIASGDVYIHSDSTLPRLPDVDVVCMGLWADPEPASRHGVFFCDRNDPQQLAFMMQKPSPAEIRNHRSNFLTMMDIGIWILSPRAVAALMASTGWVSGIGDFSGGLPRFYDLYGEFGLSLGREPSRPDSSISALSVRIVHLTGGEFYHFGTTREMVSSTLQLQNRVQDQRKIWHRDVKPHPDLFMQNANCAISFTPHNHHIWVENGWIGPRWNIHYNHVFTGIPQNDWELDVPASVCIDVVPVDESHFVLRPYGYFDTFSGRAVEAQWMGCPLKEWLSVRGLSFQSAGIDPNSDIQQVPLFPMVSSIAEADCLLSWMIAQSKFSYAFALPELSYASKQEESSSAPDRSMGALWQSLGRMSASDLNRRANMKRLYAQREALFLENLPLLAKNQEKSVFYQVDLLELSRYFAQHNLPLPPQPEFRSEPLKEMSHKMFLASVASMTQQNGDLHEQAAFGCLREVVVEMAAAHPVMPKLAIQEDQIVWGRSPVRLDLAGGWTDTPPFCLSEGGSVINLAVELNGQQPLQAFARRIPEPHIILRSIDLGSSERITTYQELSLLAEAGSPFSIPKAALSLAGFHPRFSSGNFASLRDQLTAFGGGIELTLLSAVPKGSGLGTSSILAATVLGTLSDFCALGWDAGEICRRTLSLEQLLTTGGGWQDQYGGILPGLKWLETLPGMVQMPVIRWLPDRMFLHPDTHASMLLYYTGITRMAKQILAEIVRGMFLNSRNHLSLLREMQEHARNFAEALQRDDFRSMGVMVGRSRYFNRLLDSGTEPPAVEQIGAMIEPYTLGYKLLGAGGGGYMFIVAKDPEAALRIRALLHANPINEKARFVEFALSQTGFRVSRS
ncbi:MAG: bifunctional fucokinase/fucose-1-phosphate guanylyltransferase [Bacteroidales bacterium]